MSGRDDYRELARISNGFGCQVIEDAEAEATAALAEVDDLRRWKREASTILGYWDEVFEAAQAIGGEALLGDSKSKHAARVLRGIGSEVARLRWINGVQARTLKRVQEATISRRERMDVMAAELAQLKGRS